MAQDSDQTGALYEIDRGEGGSAVVRLSGDWRVAEGLPNGGALVDRLTSGPAVRRVTFDAAGLGEWDTGLLTCLTEAMRHCAAEGIDGDPGGLPEGVRRLLALAASVPVSEGVRRSPGHLSWLARTSCPGPASGTGETPVPPNSQCQMQ